LLESASPVQFAHLAPAAEHTCSAAVGNDRSRHQHALPDPINKLLFVCTLALSQENMATARQVQLYWGGGIYILQINTQSMN